MKYLDFSAKDFVMDEYFQRWILRPDPVVNSFWESWLAQNPEKLKCINEAREVVLLINFNRYDFSKDDSLEVWENINTAIENHEDQKKQKFSVKSNLHMPMYRYWYKMAAVFLGIILLSAAYFLLSQHNSMTEYVTGYGETQTIVLPDSSTVVLNANSTLTFNSDWDGESLLPSQLMVWIGFSKISAPVRQVWLEGEAFFNVLKTKNIEAVNAKFIVHTNHLNVEVLGTKFNVNSRRGKTKIVLNSGKVKLNSHPEGRGKMNAFIMKPGELVEFSDENKQFTKKNVAPEVYSSWRNNKLIFDEISIGEIALILEDNYGIKVSFENTKVADRKFRGTFPANDVDVLLATLSKSFEMKISKNKDLVVFVGN